MKKALKWSGIGILGLFVVIIAALFLIPMFIDIQDYKPRLESLVSDQTGREFKIGGDLELSLFPWAGVAFSDLTLGNPEGYRQENFISIESFDVQFKLLPLVTSNVEVKRFVTEGFNLALERSAAGKGNWGGLGASPEMDREIPEPRRDGDPLGLPIQSLYVGECAVKEGTISLIDHETGITRTLSIENLTAQKAKLSDLNMKLAASAGRYEFDPIDLKAYEGKLTATALLDVRKDSPVVSADLKAQNIQVQELLRDLLDKDFLEGSLEACAGNR